MKRLFTVVSFVIILISIGFARDNIGHNKLTLTIHRKGMTKTEEIYSMTYDFNKLSRSTSLVNNGAGIINIECSRHLSHFLLEAASGDSSNVINAEIKYYGNAGQLSKTIELKQALITDVEEGFGGDNEGSDNHSSLTVLTNNLIIDGVKM